MIDLASKLASWDNASVIQLTQEGHMGRLTLILIGIAAGLVAGSVIGRQGVVDAAGGCSQWVVKGLGAEFAAETAIEAGWEPFGVHPLGVVARRCK